MTLTYNCTAYVYTLYMYSELTSVLSLRPQEAKTRVMLKMNILPNVNVTLGSD